MPVPRASVIIPAAGDGRRFIAAAAGGKRNNRTAPTNKVFAILAGKPVLAHVLGRFAAVKAVAEVVVAVPESQLEWATDTFRGALGDDRRLVFVAGGAERTDSVAAALAVSNRGTELVAIHDAARPLIRPSIIEEALRVAVEHGAAVVGRPVDHTIKTLAESARGSERNARQGVTEVVPFYPDARRVAETVPRRGLWMAQTPQVFRREVITQAYERRMDMVGSVTDDAQLVEAMGQTVMMVPGDAANIKITTPEDLRICEAILAAGWPFEP